MNNLDNPLESLTNCFINQLEGKVSFVPGDYVGNRRQFYMEWLFEKDKSVIEKATHLSPYGKKAIRKAEELWVKLCYQLESWLSGYWYKIHSHRPEPEDMMAIFLQDEIGEYDEDKKAWVYAVSTIEGEEILVTIFITTPAPYPPHPILLCIGVSIGTTPYHVRLY